MTHGCARLDYATFTEGLDGKAPMFTQLRLARTLCFAGAILTFSGGAISLTATPASAHTPTVMPSCTGLAVSLLDYTGNATNNRVTTTINGVSTVADFGASYSNTFAWSPTASHTWTVVVDANRNSGNPTEFDVSFAGTEQACQTAPTTTTTTTAPTTTTTTVAPTTTAPTTTLVLSEAPTTTLALSEAPTTTATTLVASQAPVPTTVDPNTVQLPRTGDESGRIVILGLAMFGLGLTLIGLARRSRPVSS